MLVITLLLSTIAFASCYDPNTDVEYLLYTRNNQWIADSLKPDDPSSVINSNFDASKRTVFMVHGWTENAAYWNPYKDLILDSDDVNIFLVDWSKGSSNPDYSIPRYRVRPTGVALCRFINFLKSIYPFDNSLLDFYGFSFGAHIVANAAKHCPNVSRCAFLDAAGPLFNTSMPDCASTSDCVYTEAIHTNPGGLGIDENIALVDFYVNEGQIQPWCLFSNVCSHYVARTLYYKSLQGYEFEGKRCPNPANKTAKACNGPSRLLLGYPLNANPPSTSFPNVYFVSSNKLP